MNSKEFDFRVHYCQNVSWIMNVDADKICHLQLISDCCELTLKEVPTSTGVALNLYCGIPGSEGRIEIKLDGDVAIIGIGGSGSGSAFGSGHTVGKGKAPNLYREVLDEYLDINWNKVNDEPNDASEGEEAYSLTESNDEEWVSGKDAGGGSESSSDGEEQDVEAINVEMYMRRDLFEVKEGEKINFKRGMLFEDVKHFREVLKDYAIEKAFKLVRDKNEKVKVTAHCGSDGCEWRIHASPLPDRVTFQVGRMPLYRAKRKAMEWIEGSHSRSYAKLPSYAVEVRSTNPAIQSGFKEGCMPFISVDGCHLKGPYGGVLLSAVALDGDSRLYPLAFAVVESEYGQKGIEIALQQILPEAHHRRCCRHLFNHWIGSARSKPILSLVDSIRVKMMGMMHKRFEKGNTWPNRVAPTVMKKLVKIKQDARLGKVTFGGGEAYEVMDEGKINIVNLGTRTCCCKMWDISGVPCKHATAVITSKRISIEDYCDSYYSNGRYLMAYGEIIHPIHDESMWPEAPGDAVQPPPLRRMPGRLRKNRVREDDEGAAATSIMRRSNTVRGVAFVKKLDTTKGHVREHQLEVVKEKEQPKGPPWEEDIKREHQMGCFLLLVV
ncbi:hypothetical protein Acr_00g0085760 [Actinidia rufa]|uniref:SWIM-type domain-containing protein n=1 Tax=Actinidia rufa TaxID=165716 RepID=A0A7J0DVR0_9ERIC|nr:hypothetical protein Acr_00g0085760 [Actinidia rufa]